MTNKQAIEQLEWYFEEDNGISADLVTKQAFNIIKMEEIREKEKIEHNPCETCGYTEGSPFCLQYCPYDAERKKEQELCDAISREAVMRLIENKPYDWSNLTERHNMLMEIRKLPSVTRQMGKWIEMDGYDGDVYYDCSECGESWTTIEGTPWDNGMKFCPNCGAKMVEPQESEG